MTYDNPASRLKEILEAGLKADRKLQCANVWRGLLGSGSDSADDFYSRLGTAMDLPRQIVAALLTHFPHQVASASLWRAPVDTAFMNQQLGATWESFIQHINAYCVPQLSLVGDLLHNSERLVLADGEKVQELINNLSALSNDIEKSSVTPEIKIFLLRSLADLIRALREYRIGGGIASVRVTESIVGHASRDKSYFNFLRDEELGKRVLDNLNAVAAVMTVYVSLPALAAPVFQLLGAP